MESFCTKNFLISNEQCGFLKGKSAELAVQNLTEKIKSNTDTILLTMGTFIDLTKVFDLIGHWRLQNKLYLYGFRGVPL